MADQAIQLPEAATTTSKERIFVDIDGGSIEEDVLLCSVTHGGFTFRGALLKVKSWPCPSIPPLSTSPAVASFTAESTEKPDNLPPNGDQAVELSEVAPGLAQVPSSEDLEKKPVPENSDFAAIQHRWSYFQKNVPNLPRKNFPSRRERDRLDQVPKLRPRNFLCAKCKFALPGFSRATSQNVPAGANSNGIPSDLDNNLNPNSNICTSPSHIRKGKLPLKRGIGNRAGTYDNSPNDWGTDSLVDTLKSEESGEVLIQKQLQKPTGTSRKDKTSMLGKRKRMLASEGLPKISLPPADEPETRMQTMATVLTPPSGDNGLKMKIKLSASTSPLPSAEDKVKIKRTREKKHKPVVEVEDDDDDDDRPRLRIDDSFPAESAEDALLSQPSTSDPSSNSSVPHAPKKRRTKIATLSPSSSGISIEKKEQPRLAASGEAFSNNLPTPVARAVTECLTKDGRTFAVGDIVWGKLTGYPHWPGKINHIVVCDDPMLERSASALTLTDSKSLPILQYQEAQIEWYGQKASISYIEVNQLSHFVEDFEKKFKPKLRGSYAEAIKIANEAVRNHCRNAGPETGQDEEPEEKDIFSELAAMEVRKAQDNLATNSSPPKTSSGNDIYEFTTNDIFGRPSGGQRPRDSSFSNSTFNSGQFM